MIAVVLSVSAIFWVALFETLPFVAAMLLAAIIATIVVIFVSLAENM